jgi:biopolymer transport protein ExbD
MYRVAAPDPLKPLGEMNTTPLIDVLLVLLVMLIVTIPAATNAVKFDLAPPTTVQQPIRPSNLLTIKADGSFHWNGLAVDQDHLRALLAATSQMDAAPELHLQPDADAKHGDVDKLLVLIKKEQVRRFGFIGNEKYRNVF